MARAYRYLNVDGGPLQSKLIAAIAALQPRATTDQWKKMIQALTQKGVKATEIEESTVLVSFFAGMDPKQKVERDDIVRWLRSSTPTIKELPLRSPQFKDYSHHKDIPGSDYRETLYILNNEDDNARDRLEELRFEIDELGFDLPRLAADPQAALALAAEHARITEKLKKGGELEHTTNHFSAKVNDPQTGKPIRNLLGHVRELRFGDTLLIEEIQSDWAQKARRLGRGADSDAPEAPFIGNTESWAGLLLRRTLQRAAEDKTIARVAWITGNYRNGWWDFNGHDGLNDFYEKIVPKLADKAISGTGVKTRMMSLNMGTDHPDVSLPGIEMTDKVREKLRAAQPLYSKDVVGSGQSGAPHSWERTLHTRKTLEAMREMLGARASIMLAGKLIDVANGEQIAGRQEGRFIEVSLSGRDPAMALAHESWHYAYQHLLSPSEKLMVDAEFLPGRSLNRKVREALREEGADPRAIAQCDNAQEACAHAFALWYEGKLEVPRYAGLVRRVLNESDQAPSASKITITGIFQEVKEAFESLHRFISRLANGLPREDMTVQGVFEAIKSGARIALDAPLEELDAPFTRARARHSPSGV